MNEQPRADAAVDLERIRLGPGAHASPRDGACVVELASLIAGEEFNDRPECVCPVIAAFLRGWNDRASYAERQRLRPYAERIVGSRADREITRARRKLCLGWANRRLPAPISPGPMQGLATRARIAVHIGLVPALRANEGAADYAARVAFSRGDHEGAFRLLEALLAVGEPSRDPVPAPLAAGERGAGPAAGDGEGPAPAGAIARRRSHEDDARCGGPRTRFSGETEIDEDAPARTERRPTR